jgi:hypothetical protein
MSELHSSIGASSMYRWSACPGSVRESKGKPTLQSEYAEEGTDAHVLAATWLRGDQIPFPNTDDLVERYTAVEEYVNYVQTRCEPGDVMLIEHKFDLSAIHPGCYGTADAVIWKPKKKLLVVVDYKHGAGLLVQVTNNSQLKYYALGALVTCKFPAEIVEMVIVQPRCPHPDGSVRSQTISAIDLLDFYVDLQDFARATEDPNAPLVPGEHCRFCPAAPSCPELLHKTQALAVMEFRSDLSYDPQKLKLALDSRPAVQAWLKAVDEFAYNEAEAGRCPPGYKLVAKRPTRKWKDEERLKEALDGLGLPEKMTFESKSLLSPAKMERAGVNKVFVEQFCESVSSGHTLVSESDPRPAVKPGAKEEFSTAVGGSD